MRRFKSLYLFLFLLLIFAGFQVSADSLSVSNQTVEGSGRQVTEVRELSSFNRIEIEGSADIIITSSRQQSVKVSTDHNLIPMVKTEVSHSGTLVINTEGSFNTKTGIKIEIATPVLEGIWAAGSGTVRISDLAEKTFDVEVAGPGSVEIDGTLSVLLVAVSGSGDVKYSGEADEVDVTDNASGNVHLSGEASEMVITVSGSGNVHARDMITEEVSVRVSSSGNVKITATEYFDGAVYDSGNIEVYGNPRHFSHKETGIGKIHKR